MPARDETRGLLLRDPSRIAIHAVHLTVERPQVVEISHSKQAAGQQKDQAREPLAHIEAMDAEHAKKPQQDPGHVVVEVSRRVSPIRIFIHARDKEQVNDPADKQQPQREEPDSP